jgi:hypothetical protein
MPGQVRAWQPACVLGRPQRDAQCRISSGKKVERPKTQGKQRKPARRRGLRLGRHEDRHAEILVRALAAQLIQIKFQALKAHIFCI